MAVIFARSVARPDTVGRGKSLPFREFLSSSATIVWRHGFQKSILTISIKASTNSAAPIIVAQLDSGV